MQMYILPIDKCPKLTIAKHGVIICEELQQWTSFVEHKPQLVNNVWWDAEKHNRPHSVMLNNGHCCSGLYPLPLYWVPSTANVLFCQCQVYCLPLFMCSYSQFMRVRAKFFTKYVAVLWLNPECPLYITFTDNPYSLTNFLSIPTLLCTNISLALERILNSVSEIQRYTHWKYNTLAWLWRTKLMPFSKASSSVRLLC